METPIEDLQGPDWSREKPRGFWDPGRKLLKSIRDYQSAKGPLSGAVKRLAVMRHRFWSAVTSCDIPLTAQLGGGLMLPHPLCIVIHPDAVVGDNCMIMNSTTLGVAKKDSGAPILEAGTDISVGARVLGGVRLGKRCIVAANAVVTKDVAAFDVVGGIPAKKIGER